MIYYWLALIGYGIARGIHEGMIHIKFHEPMAASIFEEGVRMHRWHERYYHKITVLRDLLCIVLGWRFMTTDIPVCAIAASAFLLWELVEVFESIARIGKPIMQYRLKPYEHINFADYGFKLHGYPVYFMHAGRILLFIVLIVL